MADRKLKLSELEKALSIIFAHYREEGIEEFPLDMDYYWSIDKEQRYDPYKDPKDIGLGQLYDDAEAIERLLSSKDGAIGYHLVCLSTLLRYIGEHHI